MLPILEAYFGFWVLPTYTRIFLVERVLATLRCGVASTLFWSLLATGGDASRGASALEGDGFPCPGIAGDIKRAVSAAIGECIGIADAPADIAGAMCV